MIRAGDANFGSVPRGNFTQSILHSQSLSPIPPVLGKCHCVTGEGQAHHDRKHQGHLILVIVESESWDAPSGGGRKQKKTRKTPPPIFNSS